MWLNAHLPVIAATAAAAALMAVLAPNPCTAAAVTARVVPSPQLISLSVPLLPNRRCRGVESATTCSLTSRLAPVEGERGGSVGRIDETVEVVVGIVADRQEAGRRLLWIEGVQQTARVVKC